MTAPLTLEQRVERIEAILGLGSLSVLPPVPWPLRRAALLRDAARLFHVSVEELVGPSRVRPLVMARAAIVVALRSDPPMGYCELGRLLHRDHSSVIGLERIGKAKMACNRTDFADLVAELRRGILPAPVEQAA